MRIGIFDSGLGGLIITKGIIKTLPHYNYTYLGDIENIPYGKKTQSQILNLTKKVLIKLFLDDCKIVIIACNTSSAKALRKIQQEFLPKYYPDRKVLGVIIPTLESIPPTAKRVGILATISTVKSHSYKKELKKIYPKLKVIEQSAPELATLIENGEYTKAENELKKYTFKLLKQKVDTIVLGCTHYAYLKKHIQKITKNKATIISQDDIIPQKLKQYLNNHSEIEKLLDKNYKQNFQVTKINKNYDKISKQLFGKRINFILTKI